jgi:hypothetical protein
MMKYPNIVQTTRVSGIGSTYVMLEGLELFSVTKYQITVQTTRVSGIGSILLG